MTLELELPYPPTLNTYWRHVGSKVLLSSAGRRYRSDVLLLVLGAGRPRLEGRLAVEIDVYPPDRRKRDLDNLNKAVLDALEHAQVFEDDGQIDKLTVERREVVTGGKLVVRLLAYPSCEELLA